MSFFGSPVIRFILDDSALYLSDKCETDTVDLRRGATHDENHAGGADIITHVLSLTVFFVGKGADNQSPTFLIKVNTVVVTGEVNKKACQKRVTL